MSKYGFSFYSKMQAESTLCLSFAEEYLTAQALLVAAALLVVIINALLKVTQCTHTGLLLVLRGCDHRKCARDLQLHACVLKCVQDLIECMVCDSPPRSGSWTG